MSLRNLPDLLAAGAGNVQEPVDLSAPRSLLDEINLLRHECEHLSREVHGLRDQLRRVYNSRLKGAILSPLEPPIFCSCIFQSPTVFLNSLMEYVRLTRVPLDSFKYVAGQALKGQAYEWFIYVRHRINSIQDFNRLFLERFWNDGIQMEIRRRLEFGSYAEALDPNQSRSEYVIKIWNYVKALENPPGEQIFVEFLSRHFDTQLRMAIESRGIASIDQLIDFLDANPATNQDG